MYYVQHYLRQPLQIPITNSILHYVTCYAVQRYWIDHMILIIADININIVTEKYSPIPPLLLCPKIKHMVEDILLCLLILVKALCDQGRRQKIRRFHNLLHLFHLLYS